MEKLGTFYIGGGSVSGRAITGTVWKFLKISKTNLAYN